MEDEHMTDTWQASSARHRFSEVVDAAVDGTPQFVRRRDGREVVVVSREYFERSQATLASYLLTAGTTRDEDDAFDRALRDIRAEGSSFIIPGPADLPG